MKKTVTVKQKTMIKPKRKTQGRTHAPPVIGPDQWKVQDLDGIGNFDTIYHLSDIHIRPLDRHEEFRNVFDNVDQQLSQAQNDSIAVITGDIFDNKTSFRPETFMLCRDFLKMVSSHMPLVVIAGNHDMMESNVNRLDSITPVVDDIPNLHYLKYSGLYHCPEASVCFSVSSLYDKAFITHNAITESNHYREGYQYLALYHGTLSGAKTDTGYVAADDSGSGSGSGSDEDTGNGAGEGEDSGSTRFRSVVDFAGYDAVLLGDIHKYQVLKPRNGVIAYAGSLIQQNHGENMDGHGILKWTRDSYNWGCELVEVANEWGFVDVHCQDGEWINPECTLPKHCYARLVIKNCTETQVTAIVAALKQRVDTLKVSKRQCVTDNLDESEIPPDIKRKEDEIELIKEQALAHGHDIDGVLRLHQQYQRDLDTDRIGMSTAVWRPIHIEFKNMFGYGNNVLNKMNFRRGITSISAGNTCGKTSIVNIILFSIFGRTPLNPSSTTYTFDIINNKQTSGFVRILLNHGGQYYLIERKTMRKNNKTSTSPVLQKLNRYDFSCTIWESNIKGERLKNCSETRKNNNDTFILELFGDIGDFSLSNLLNKESSLDLISMSPAEQIKVLKKLFRLEIYDAYKDLNKVKLQVIERDIAGKRVKLQTLQSMIDEGITAEAIEQRQVAHDGENDTLAHMRDQTSELQVQVEGLTENIRGLTAKLVSVDTSDLPADPSHVIQELESYTDIPCHTGDNADVLEYKLQDLQRQLDTISGDLSALGDLPSVTELNTDLKILREQLESLQPTDQDRKVLHEENGRISSRLDFINETLREFQDEGDLEGLKGLTIEELRGRLVPLSSSLSAIADRLNEIGDPPDQDPNFDLNIAKNTIRDLDSRIRSLELDRGVYAQRKDDSTDLTLTVEQLEQQIIPDVPQIKYAITEGELEQLSVERDSLTRQIAECSVRPSENLVKELNSAPHANGKTEISCELRDDVVLHLESGDHIRDLEVAHRDISHQLFQLQERIDINNRVEHNAILRSQIAQLKYVQCTNELDVLHKEMEVMTEAIQNERLIKEYDRLVEEETTHYDNADIRVQIDTVIGRQRAEELSREQETLLTKQKECEDALLYLDLEHDINVILADLSAHDRAEDYRKQLQKVKQFRADARNQLELQERHDRYVYLQDIMDRLNIVEENATVNQDIIILKEDLCTLKEEQRKHIQEFEQQEQKVRDLKEDLRVYQYRLEQQEKVQRELITLEAELVDLEKSIIPHQQYHTIMGNKGITSKLLFNKIKSIEEYINTIIKQFTKYKLVILYDEKKQSINMLTENKEDHNYLSTARLSGYEKLMLQIAFKRALNKFSYNSKSSLIIIDEALDCIDQDNFLTCLPEVMNLVTQDYSNCLAISQRDISHISDHIVRINTQSGNSTLE